MGFAGCPFSYVSATTGAVCGPDHASALHDDSLVYGCHADGYAALDAHAYTFPYGIADGGAYKDADGFSNAGMGDGVGGSSGDGRHDRDD